ncbi:MAG TPA: ABC transporter permease [Candidatus Binataceae bacterium]|nr:ABC transporter permease [Candidatus Binataceae bacterium]
MLRTIALTVVNEFRLLARDAIGLFMLVLAPLVIIAVAGFSLSNLFGAQPRDTLYTLPIVNDDGGPVADALARALARAPGLKPVQVPTVEAARAIVNGTVRAPLALIIPRGTSAAIARGGDARLRLYIDPIKRVELSPLEFQIDALCRAVTIAARAEAADRDAQAAADLRARSRRVAATVAEVQKTLAAYQEQAAGARNRAEALVKAQLERRMQAAIAQARQQTELAIRQAAARTEATLTHELAVRSQAAQAIASYLLALQRSEAAFARWLTQLKEAAGPHASAIPAPPAFPPAPSAATVAALTQPLDLSEAERPLSEASPVAPFRDQSITVALPPAPPLPQLPLDRLRNDLAAIATLPVPVVPGVLGWEEAPAAGASLNVNAFDQYVPGFGITFLLIAMLMGLAMGLIDERDWGTLSRLRVSGAPLSGTVIGKLTARFLVGYLQMIALLVFGRWLFDVSLGQTPAMLLVPAAAIAFAAAAFSLVVACVARTHDSVMPIGTVSAMAMSAIGGCWWPLDFEPTWMRTVADFLPTTWTMIAFNNLMIRGLPPSSAIWPSLAATALGFGFVIVGLAAASRAYR